MFFLKHAIMHSPHVLFLVVLCVSSYCKFTNAFRGMNVLSPQSPIYGGYQKGRSATRDMSGFRRRNICVSMGLGDIFRELDNFIDDAMSRKLGGGSTFYGNRKSSFSESDKSYQYASEKEAEKRDAARGKAWTDPLRKLRGGNVSGAQLRELIFKQWGQQFPVLIKRKRDALGEQRLYLIVQWKYLGKKNLDLSFDGYVAESDAVAELLSDWGVANMVKNTIQESNARPKTATQQFPGLFIPLEVDKSVVETW
mmetsp:Transcript_54564/g.65674  ORF Transcript_54564/g.65674 Transcript_54564/m.65674 type:complete len:253 (-) Transcript_54564:499-1257(-)